MNARVARYISVISRRVPFRATPMYFWYNIPILSKYKGACVWAGEWGKGEIKTRRKWLLKEIKRKDKKQAQTFLVSIEEYQSV